MRAFVFYL